MFHPAPLCPDDTTLCPQCIPQDAYCNNKEQCADRTDELECSSINSYIDLDIHPSPAVVRFDETGGLSGSVMFRIDPITYWFRVGNETLPCPGTHFRCPGDGYCLPVYMRCNGVVDCPGREDEKGCDLSTCAGFYRCRGSHVCLHESSVCDGIHQCPQHDDELFCGLHTCPNNCTCHGLAFACAGMFRTRLYPHLRYLHAEGSAMSPDLLLGSSMLVHLGLGSCGLRVLKDLIFPNLRSLDVSNNLITFISVRHLQGVLNLQVWILADNPLNTLFSSDPNSTLTLLNIHKIDLSRAKLSVVDLGVFSALPALHTLNLSHSSATKLFRSDPKSLQQLRVLDLRGLHVREFQRDVISELDDLQTVFAQNYQLCCPVVLPSTFNLKNCQTPSDAVSSCESLLASTALSVSVSVCCGVALLGNLISFIVRVFVVKGSCVSSGLGVFVTHLSVSDFLMGVCLAVLAVADLLYRGNYVLEEASWRRGVACTMVGFMALLSSQASSFLVFLITLDRFVATLPGLKRPLFRPVSAQTTSGVVWVVCVVLAAVPLLPVASHWELFSRTGLCVPLPATAKDSAGHGYTVAVVVVLNFVLVAAVAAGQTCIFVTLRSDRTFSRLTIAATAMSREASVTRRVFHLCVMNVVCWSPACLLGLLALRGSPAADEVRVGVAVLALAVGAALRPCLYALGVRAERARRSRTERLMAHVRAQRRLKDRTAT